MFNVYGFLWWVTWDFLWYNFAQSICTYPSIKFWVSISISKCVEKLIGWEQLQEKGTIIHSSFLIWDVKLNFLSPNVPILDNRVTLVRARFVNFRSFFYSSLGDKLKIGEFLCVTSGPAALISLQSTIDWLLARTQQRNKQSAVQEQNDILTFHCSVVPLHFAILAQSLYKIKCTYKMLQCNICIVDRMQSESLMDYIRA